MPSVRPRSSSPVNCARFHSPRRIEASAGAIRRARPYMQRERVLGGGDRVAGRGVDDGDPGPRRRVEVDVVDADPGPADDDEPRAGGDELGVDLDLAADDERVVVGQDRAQLVAAEARALVDLVVGAEELEALRGDGFGDEDPHAPRRPAAGAREPERLDGGAWAAATAAPGGRRARPSSEASSSVLDRAEDLLERDRARGGRAGRSCRSACPGRRRGRRRGA